MIQWGGVEERRDRGGGRWLMERSDAWPGVLHELNQSHCACTQATAPRVTDTQPPDTSWPKKEAMHGQWPRLFDISFPLILHPLHNRSLSTHCCPHALFSSLPLACLSHLHTHPHAHHLQTQWQQQEETWSGASERGERVAGIHWPLLPRFFFLLLPPRGGVLDRGEDLLRMPVLGPITTVVC